MKIDYNGKFKSIVLKFNPTLEKPVAITIHKNMLYWADINFSNGSIRVVDLGNLTNIKTVINNQEHYLCDLKIFGKQHEKTTLNLCAINNGGCSELCLFNGTVAICACAHGQISADGKTCENYDLFLIYSRVTSIESIHMTDHLNMNGPIPKLQNSKTMKNAIGLTYDYERKLIFYSDIQYSTINMVNFNGTNHTVIVNKQSLVEGLAYNSITNELYWTSNTDTSIRAINFKVIDSNITNNTKKVKEIIRLNVLDKPRGNYYIKFIMLRIDMNNY